MPFETFNVETPLIGNQGTWKEHVMLPYLQYVLIRTEKVIALLS